MSKKRAFFLMFATLAVLMAAILFVMILIVCIYQAFKAARIEPVDALHSL